MVSSCTATLLVSSSSVAFRSSADRSFSPWICVASSARDTSGTRRHVGCCHEEIQPYSPPRHLMGTPTRTVAFAMSSLHLWVEEGDVGGWRVRRGDAHLAIHRSPDLAKRRFRRRVRESRVANAPAASRATSLGDLHQMAVRGLVLVLGGLPFSASLLVLHHRERRCHGASWCVVTSPRRKGRAKSVTSARRCGKVPFRAAAMKQKARA